MEISVLLTIALRVLSDVVYHKRADASDVQMLKDAAPEHRDDKLDDLARHVIQRELARRKATRSGATGG